MTLVSDQQTDAALMREVQAGGRAALEELYVRFAPPAYRTAMSVCRDHECAQDAVQDAFVAIWRSRASYRFERGPVVHWAMSIVRHRAIYLARRRSVRRGLDEGTTRLEAQAAEDDVPSDVESREDAEQLKLQLARLPRTQQHVIQLAFFNDLTHREIARRLGLPRMPGSSWNFDGDPRLTVRR